jgi:hypothetical protein
VAIPLMQAAPVSAVFDKPADNIGFKAIADDPSCAAQHLYSVNTSC